MTPLYPTFQKRVNDAVDLLIKQQVTPWMFMHSGHPLRVKKFDGSEISYAGIRFGGSSRDVFWGRYIEPFLEDLCVSEISTAITMAKEKNVDGRALLKELQGLLQAGFQRVYGEMSEVDRRLLGAGHPETVAKRRIEHEITNMNTFLAARIAAESSMWRPKSRLELWHERNQFWVWIVQSVIGVAAIIISCIALILKSK
jgi:hypothetical protein